MRLRNLYLIPVVSLLSLVTLSGCKLELEIKEPFQVTFDDTKEWQQYLSGTVYSGPGSTIEVLTQDGKAVTAPLRVDESGIFHFSQSIDFDGRTEKYKVRAVHDNGSKVIEIGLPKVQNKVLPGKVSKETAICSGVGNNACMLEAGVRGISMFAYQGTTLAIKDRQVQINAQGDELGFAELPVDYYSFVDGHDFARILDNPDENWIAVRSLKLTTHEGEVLNAPIRVPNKYVHQSLWEYYSGIIKDASWPTKVSGDSMVMLISHPKTREIKLFGEASHLADVRWIAEGLEVTPRIVRTCNYDFGQKASHYMEAPDVIMKIWDLKTRVVVESNVIKGIAPDEAREKCPEWESFHKRSDGRLNSKHTLGKKNISAAIDWVEQRWPTLVGS